MGSESPMRRAASANLKKPKREGLWEDLKEIYDRIVKPIGYKPPPLQGIRPSGPGRRQMEQVEAVEKGTWGSKPPKSTYVPYPTGKEPAKPEDPAEAMWAAQRERLKKKYR